MSPYTAVLPSCIAWLTLVGSASAQTFYEQAKLVADDAAPDASFGCGVALEGDIAVVGAYRDSRPGLFRAGAAHVLVRGGSTWTTEAKLVASDARERDGFGRSVSLSGDTVLVGARWDDVWYFGSLKEDSGSAHVFVRNGTSWSEQALLTVPAPIGVEYFGASVALSGETAVIGAYGDRNMGSTTGAAYVFVRSGTNWSEQARLLASDGAHGDLFGLSVALDGDTAMVGAPEDGSAYVFVRAGTTWMEQAKLVPSDGEPQDSFGYSVAISGDRAIVGAPSKDLSGVPDTFAGAAYVFVRSGTQWTEQARLVSDTPGTVDTFGTSVALSGDRAVVGSPGSDPGGRSDGVTFVFERFGTTWTLSARLVADRSYRDGTSVALSGDTVLVGAEQDDHCAGQEGSAYVFGPTPGPPHPRISSITPTSTPALVPGTAKTITITGADLDLTTELLLDCVPVEPARYAIVGPSLITLDMPQAPALGINHLGVGDGVRVDSVRIQVDALASPAYQLGSGEPLDVEDRDGGLDYILAGPIGSVHYLFASDSSQPSSNRYVNLDIGNGFTQLYQLARHVIPASGWLEVTIPAAQLPDPGPSGMVFYSQTIMMRGGLPLPVSNLQSMQLIQ